MNGPLNNRMREVLHAIDRQADGDAQGTRMSIPQIAAQIGYSTHTVRLAMKELRTCGLLKCFGSGRRGATKVVTDPFLKSRDENFQVTSQHVLNEEIPFEPRGQINALIVSDGIASKCANLAWKWVNLPSRVLDVLPSKEDCTNYLLESKRSSPNPSLKTVPTSGTLSLSRPVSRPGSPLSPSSPAPSPRSFPPSPSEASGVVGRDLFGGADVARNGDLVSVMARVWNEAQERKRAHWKDYLRLVNPSKIPAGLHDRMLRAWKENNLNIDQWRAACNACVTNVSLAGLSDRWDGATLAWLVRPDRTHVADVLSRKWQPDFNPANPPGTF